MDQADLLPISALQHLLFCERQAALIHVERLWAENRLTVEGRLMHKRAHDPKARGAPRSATTPAGVRVQRGVELASIRLGLFGVSDIVEFPPESNGIPRPVEYKRGRPKSHDADKVQLCAQAICLEEMLRLPPGSITVGALFYGKTRRRLDVPLDATLRMRTETAAARMHEIVRGGMTPPASRQPKCDHCSLLHLCLPDALRPRRTASTYLRRAAEESLTADPATPT
ncbi:MAG: CRISPR-associated protein Cas4 [Phycisphaeraceae bacterium]|nr:CRISPR-associated protein Cas4 [Phycisphaeraceae bacterium]